MHEPHQESKYRYTGRSRKTPTEEISKIVVCPYEDNLVPGTPAYPVSDMESLTYAHDTGSTWYLTWHLALPRTSNVTVSNVTES